MCSNVPQNKLDIPSNLGATRLIHFLAQNAFARAKKVLKLEDPGVVLGQVLLLVPDRGAETLETPVPLEPDPGGSLSGRVNLVGEHGF